MGKFVGFVQQTEQDLETLRNSAESSEMIKYLDEAKEDINITEAKSLLGTIKDAFSEGSGNRDHMLSTQTKPGRIEVSTGLTPINVKYSQIYGVKVDDILSISSEVLNHELVHAFDILTGQWAKDSKELIKSDKVRARMEARAMQRTNKLRIRKLHLIRTEYNGVKLLTPTNKIIPGVQKKLIDR